MGARLAEGFGVSGGCGIGCGLRGCGETWRGESFLEFTVSQGVMHFFCPGICLGFFIGEGEGEGKKNLEDVRITRTLCNFEK